MKYLILLLFVFLLAGCAVDSGEVYEGVTLISPLNADFIYLVDMDGEMIHSWDVGVLRPFGELLDDGTLLYIANTTATPSNLEESGAVLREVSWDGEILWEYNDIYMHHDFAKMDNGNILIIRWEEMDEENVELLSFESKGMVWIDEIVEIDYITKEIIWEWKLQNHYDFEAESYSQTRDFSHINAVDYLPSYNGREAILISSRHLDTIFIIDKVNGEILWEFGQGVLEGQHDPTLLENGNILVFDNGITKSRVVEINPLTNKIVWTYEDEEFFSDHISGAQRLPNGNTLICEGVNGRVFEVTENKEIVWEYVNEFPAEGKPEVFRSYRYDLDF